MDDGMVDIELCLENYKTLIYNGNLDIICNHSGILDMISTGLDLINSGQSQIKYITRFVILHIVAVLTGRCTTTMVVR